MKDTLSKLFQGYFSRIPGSFIEITGSGSHRRYFRMSVGNHRCVGVYSPNPLETRAFLEFTRHFGDRGLNVPSVLAEEGEKGVYLLEDLGDLSLKKLLDSQDKETQFSSSLISYYKSALDHLVEFQLEGHKGLDYSVCFPRQEFDRQSILWDLNHFKYYFIHLLNIPSDEQKLEEDFNRLADHLLSANRDFFMFRDFQSRNIMIHNDELYFIDYQGGRKGALQYDVASLLYEARTNLPQSLRDELLDHYLETLEARNPEAANGFKDHYYGYVLIRILQAMGAYGIRGIVENKALFLQSIPYAIKNVSWLMENSLIPDQIPELVKCLKQLCRLKEWAHIPDEERSNLRVRISSFSYKKGPPRDLTGNGGGFIFDCRALPNPGRLEEYRQLTGKDPAVIDFLEGNNEVSQFLEGIYNIISQSVNSYLSMGFKDLMVSFGCTGGQHRSVYCAEKLNEFMHGRGQVETLLEHKELD